MKKILVFLTIALTVNTINAQFIKKKSISAQIGVGLSAPINSTADFADYGFFVQGELILDVSNWIELRPYVGFVSTNPAGEDFDGNPTNEFATTKALLIGGKARVRAPIRWAAPYFEIGIGTSIGSFETSTDLDNISQSGLIYHVPISLGLELGRNNNFDLGLSYYLQPSVEQFTGAFTIGVTFPLK